MRRGIPSWLHMPALGIIPRIESREGVATPAHTPSASRAALFVESRELASLPHSCLCMLRAGCLCPPHSRLCMLRARALCG